MSERALAWSLVHFLWQGAVLGLLAASVLHLVRRPSVRYTAGCAFLLAMACAPLATYLTLARPRAVLDLNLAVSAGAAAAGLAPVARLDWMPLLNQCWMAGSSAVLFRSAGGWLLAWRRTRRGRMKFIGTRGRARIYESFSAAVPCVFGALKPVILIPAGALLRLTPEQLEAVIAHELAHVRRHDYAVNLLQTVVEGLLFYHPAVWWLSSRIRQERELCCDEAAVARCGDRAAYSRALLELEQARGEFALAATGGRLSDRIGRILGMEEKSISLAPVLTAAAVLVVWSGLVWAQKEPAKPAPPPAPEPPASPAPPPDTILFEGKTYRRKAAVTAPSKLPPPAPPKSPAYRKMSGIQPPSQRFAPHLPRLPVAEEEVRALDMQVQALMQQIRELSLRRQQLQQQAAGHAVRAQALERQQFEFQKAVADIERQVSQQAKSAERVEAEAKVAQMLARQKEQELARRIGYADERFAENGTRGSQTDRGKVYLKYGPPDEIESHAGEGREAWLYRSGPIIRFLNGRLVSIDAAI